jgi:adenine-specific DNA-methyltransferase
MPTLTWLDRETAVKAAEAVPFRVLDFDLKLSAGDPAAENLIIQGDNLDAVKAITPYFAGRVKCFAIDPPYNTRSAFEHYDDNLEHSTWLSMMYSRLELMRDLLAEDGSIWVNIDDFEAHYLKVMMDEVFGRRNFVTTIVWQMRTSRENRRVFSNNHEYMLVYAKDPDRFAAIRHDLELTEEVKGRYKNPDKDPRGEWQSVSANAQAGHGTPEQFYTLIAPNGKKHDPPKGTCWRYTWKRMQEEIASNNIWFGRDGNGVPRMKRFLLKAKAGLTPETLWLADDVGTNDFAKKSLLRMFPNEQVFETPKPESLIRQVIHIATNPGDIVCDPFLGSGTTAAVAHKMGRRYIGVEMGEHAVTHCVPRLKKVIEGEQGGISTLVNWQGGGGFRFARLGPPIFTPDGAIHPEIRFPTLAAHIWFSETRTAWPGKGESPLLGTHNGTAYYLLFNGILGDKRPLVGNVLNAVTFRHLPPHAGPKIVFGEACQWGADRLRREHIEFRKIPHGLKVR